MADIDSLFRDLTLHLTRSYTDYISDAASDDSQEDINEEEFLVNGPASDSASDDSDVGQLDQIDPIAYDSDSEDRPAPKFKVFDEVERIIDPDNWWGELRVTSMHWKDTHWEYIVIDADGDEVDARRKTTATVS